jgi:protein-tyrosine phosphatase
VENENEKRILLHGLHNARDLGGLVTENGMQTAYHRFIRSDEPSALTAKDLDALLSYPVRTVIDLRSEGEMLRRVNPFCSHPQIQFCHVSLFVSDPDETNDPNVQLAISHTLGELYIHLLNSRPQQFAEVFRCILSAPPGAILFHCTHGKDRTGIIAALLLSLVRVRREDIIRNYSVTYEYIRSIVDPKMESMAPEMQHILKSDAENMEYFLTYLDHNYDGSSYSYLQSIGLSPEEIESLSKRILA